MPKRITLNDEEYFKLLELKVKYKTDSLFAIMTNLSNVSSPKIIQQNQVKVPRWLTEKNLVTLKSICHDIEDDASESDGENELHVVQSRLGAWKRVGNTGLSDLRRYWLTQPLCTCGHPRGYHNDDGCQTNEGVCICKQYVAAESATSAQEPDQIVVDQEASNF